MTNATCTMTAIVSGKTAQRIDPGKTITIETIPTAMMILRIHSLVLSFIFNLNSGIMLFDTVLMESIHAEHFDYFIRRFPALSWLQEILPPRLLR